MTFKNPLQKSDTIQAQYCSKGMMLMRTPFKKNTEIHLTHTDGYEQGFIIDDIAGKGGSCIVYSAHHTDGDGNIFKVRIKEFYPYDLDIIRSDNGAFAADGARDEFYNRLARFENGYKQQIELRNNDELTNSISNIQGIYTGYNTKYVVMDMNVGESYSAIEDKSLFDCISVCLSTARAIKKYHDKGLVHLDIKPDNIFVYPETNDMIMLFDFDSVVRLSEIGRNTVLSSTRGYAAPELEQGRYDKIGIQTDFYSIGAMLFDRVMGRLPNSMDCSICHDDWKYELEKPVFKNVDPNAGRLLTSFFEKTLTSFSKRRYSTDDELIEALEELKKAANPENRFLYTSLSMTQSYFVGRERELAELHEALENSSTVFLSGIGGIGKSEIAKHYGQLFRDEYDAVIFGMYTGSLMSFVADDRYVHINNYSRFFDEPEKDYYERKFRVLQEIANERTLFIIDNFDTENDEKLTEVLSLGCKFIFTTRSDFGGLGYKQLDIGTLEKQSEAEELFYNYYPTKAGEGEAVTELIGLVDRHTITVELLAKQCKASRTKPAEMLKRLKEKGLKGSGRERVRISKDGMISAESTIQQLKAIFDLAGLTDGQRYVLMNLSLLPPSGVRCEDFSDWCGLESYDDINTLEATGWVRIDEDDLISLHPVIADVVYDEMKSDSSEEKCGRMITAISDLVLHRSLYFESTALYVLDKVGFNNPIDIHLFNCIQIAHIKNKMELGHELEKIKYFDTAIDACIDCIKELKVSSVFEMYAPAKSIFISELYLDLSRLYFKKKNIIKGYKYNIIYSFSWIADFYHYFTEIEFRHKNILFSMLKKITCFLSWLIGGALGFYLGFNMFRSYILNLF